MKFHDVLINEEKMPELGEIRRAREIGKPHRGEWYIWQTCEICHKERWVIFSKGEPKSQKCQPCSFALIRANKELRQKAGLALRGRPRSEETKEKISLALKREKNYNWKGGRHRDKNGYIEILLSPNDPFFPMAKKNGRVKEHRLVVARALGRCLLKTEVVHHRPDIAKDDNRLEVLYLMPNPSDHNRLNPCSNCELKKEIRLLRWQIKELTLAAQLKLGEENSI